MDIRNFTDSTGERVQPYFAAFMIERGYERAREPFERDGHNLEYMEWNGARWAEFERENGYPHDHIRSSRADEFTDWLQARCDARATLKGAA